MIASMVAGSIWPENSRARRSLASETRSCAFGASTWTPSSNRATGLRRKAGKSAISFVRLSFTSWDRVMQAVVGSVAQVTGQSLGAFAGCSFTECPDFQFSHLPGPQRWAAYPGWDQGVSGQASRFASTSGCDASVNSRNSPVTKKAVCSPTSTAWSPTRSI